MLYRILIGLVVTALWSGALSVSAQSQQASDVARILERRSASNEALAQRDAEAFQRILDDEYHITLGNGGFENATMAASMVRQLMDSEPYVLYVRTATGVDVGTSGIRAFETGTWVGETESGEQRRTGRYAAHWRKREGTWRIHSEVFVTLRSAEDR